MQLTLWKIDETGKPYRGGGGGKYGRIHARMFDWGNKYSKKEIK